MTDESKPEQQPDTIAHYEALRDELNRLTAAPEPDRGAIDRTIDALNRASATYRHASTGVDGNNPDDNYGVISPRGF